MSTTPRTPRGNRPAASASIPVPALESVARSKLAPPRIGGPLVLREALLARLQQARRRRCIAVTGPAGAGKTTLLASWRQALLGLGFEVAWLTLSPEDDEPARLLDGLLASLAEVDASLVREAMLLDYDGSDADSIERALVTVLRGVAQRPRELTLVLDDLHHLGDPRVHEHLQWLLDYAPGNLHLVLASRSALRLSLARLRSRQQTLELDRTELRFTRRRLSTSCASAWAPTWMRKPSSA